MHYAPILNADSIHYIATFSMIYKIMKNKYFTTVFDPFSWVRIFLNNSIEYSFICFLVYNSQIACRKH